MVSREISLDEALFMLSSYKLGRTGYTSLEDQSRLTSPLQANAT